MQRRKLSIEGLVQGVGFRPFVFVLAERLGLNGHVLNNSRGVEIEIEADSPVLDAFSRALVEELPPLAHISRLKEEQIPVTGEVGFGIQKSEAGESRKAQITPDAHVCPDCLDELFDPSDRRFKYPFINCTNCGPRYTIVQDIPYDRSKTTMADFPMCPICQAEYDDPKDRRFHAQPNACPDCGPSLTFYNERWEPQSDIDPLDETIRRLREGQILAIKGLGGYHLAVDATRTEAVEELRRRKARDEKPFALMVAELDAARAIAEIDDQEAELLQRVQRPIVLLKKRPGNPVCDAVAPRNGYFGVMLPGTPLHYLLLRAGFTALVMTSGNLSDEPIAYGDEDAGNRLQGIADGFLAHNRQVHIRTDDSIVREMNGRPLVLRRSRGYVPRAVYLPEAYPPVLAVGAELKNTVCLTQDDRAFLSHHIGDLKNAETIQSFEGAIDHLKSILEVEPAAVAYDLHPDYASSRFAQELKGIPLVGIQHHHAHLASCMAENGVTEPTIGVIFDGIGYGADGHIWGGEFLLGDFYSYRRLGHLNYTPMPGGDAATKEPGRMALAYLVQAYGANGLPDIPVVNDMAEGTRRLLLQMIDKGLNSPLTSSCGRLFDAVAAMAGVRTQVNYEGQAALELEQTIVDDPNPQTYSVFLEFDEGWIWNTRPLIRDVVDDVLAGIPAGVISRRFHLAMAEGVLQVCQRICEAEGVDRVALSGGVFQNRFLTEVVADRLQQAGFDLLLHSEIPPNDGGLSLGQAVVAGCRLNRAD